MTGPGERPAHAHPPGRHAEAQPGDRGGIDYAARRELDKAPLRQLRTGRWIAEHQHVLITGTTGTGKTFAACALAHQACRQGYRARYWRVSPLFTACALARVDVLLLDDFALQPLQEAERRDLLEILEDRYGARSTIVTSQLAPPPWHAAIGDPTLADASVTGCFTTATASWSAHATFRFAGFLCGSILISPLLGNLDDLRSTGGDVTLSRKFLWRCLGVLAALGVAIQLVPYGRDHAARPVRREPVWDQPATRTLVARACFDCHSNHTVWPWYTQVAPVSWLVQQDVDEGRAHVNFSEWNRLQRGLRGVRNDVTRGQMPPWYYLPLHPGARLSSAEKEALLQGLAATMEKDPPPQPPPRRAADAARKTNG